MAPVLEAVRVKLGVDSSSSFWMLLTFASKTGTYIVLTLGVLKLILFLIQPGAELKRVIVGYVGMCLL